ncbi:hypothetical protein E0L36_23685 [Streptomyces sp. AJS327]|uniref:hypothetical protein n=1 Tax=Streptomyces sp. AJS327 TaxID=2545265 RepID=UPI0015DEE7D9|nr:hypothetical protein [Streptomyces sp. AJS327]MBA0053753.1 hypothetical protein [Streptomyces sp. AJS327]
MRVEAVAEIWVRKPESGWQTGSGYLIAQRLLLTAAHTLSSDEVKVRLLGDGVLRKARVIWQGAGLLDAALVEIIDPNLELAWKQPIRFGRFMSSSPRVDCEAVGFPDSAMAFEGPEQIRDSEHLSAWINPLARRKQQLLDVRLDNWPDSDSGEPSRWSGMSGSALWCGDLLVGVIAWDTPAFAQRRLTAVPLHSLSAQDGFRHAVEAHTGRPLRLEPVELCDLLFPWYPAQGAASPAGLLRAEHEVVPFIGREDTIKQLAGWCLEPASLSAWLITGPGGQGKTRLARRLCEEMETEGWVTGLVANQADVAAHLSTLTRTTSPVLLVLDYIETGPNQAQQIIDWLAEHPPFHPVRLLLLARASGEWFAHLHAASAAIPGVLRFDPLTLPGLVETPAGREHLWQRAVAAFSEGLQNLGYEVLESRRKPLDSSRATAGQALALHASALTSLLPEEAPRVSPEEVLLSHERRYWNRIAESRNLGLGHVRQVAMMAAQLCGPTPRAEALQILAALPGLGGDGAEESRRALAEWVGDLYPPRPAGSSLWGSLQPDPLAECYIATAVAGESDVVTKVITGAGPEQQSHAVTLLARAAARPGGTAAAESLARAAAYSPIDLSSVLIEAARRVESPMALVGSLEAAVHELRNEINSLEELYDKLPEETIALAGFAAELTAKIVEYYRESGDSKALASWLSDHSVRLGAVGKREESLKAISEAVAHSRRLSSVGPEEMLQLAVNLTNQSNSFGELGLHEKALQAGAEAVEIFSGLNQASRGQFTHRLADALTNQAASLSALGEWQDAVNVSASALGMFRSLAEVHPDLMVPRLALALDNQSRAFMHVGRNEESLAAIAESVEIYRGLAERFPDQFQVRLAASLSNQSICLGRLGRRQAALVSISESAEIRQKLAEERPDMFGPSLAASLTNKAQILRENGQCEIALQASSESVRVYRKIVDGAPEAFLPELATALANQSSDFNSLEMLREALDANAEALEIFESLAQSNPKAFLSKVAGLLNNQSIRLHRIGEFDEAVKASTRSVELFQALMKEHPGAFLSDLALSLTNYSSDLNEVGRGVDAIEAISSAVSLLRKLTRSNPGAFLPNLAGALGNQSTQLRSQGRLEEALASSEEAVGIFQALSSVEPDAFESDLALSLENRASILNLLERAQGGLRGGIPGVQWTPLLHPCGCVIEWGWESDSVPPPLFIDWCVYVVGHACPWHGGEAGLPTSAPDGAILALPTRDSGFVFYARLATGEQIVLGESLSGQLHGLMAKAGTQDRSALLEEIPPRYREWLSSQGHDPVEAWFGQRLTDILLNRRTESGEVWSPGGSG